MTDIANFYGSQIQFGETSKSILKTVNHHSSTLQFFFSMYHPFLHCSPPRPPPPPPPTPYQAPEAWLWSLLNDVMRGDISIPTPPPHCHTTHCHNDTLSQWHTVTNDTLPQTAQQWRYRAPSPPSFLSLSRRRWQSHYLQKHAHEL